MRVVKRVAGVAMVLGFLAMSCQGEDPECECVEEQQPEPGADMGTSGDMMTSMMMTCDGEDPLGVGRQGEQKCAMDSIYICANGSWVKSEIACTTEASLRITRVNAGCVVEGFPDNPTRSYALRLNLSNDGDLEVDSLRCQFTAARSQAADVLGDGDLSVVMGEAEVLSPTQATVLEGAWMPQAQGLGAFDMVFECQGNAPGGRAVYESVLIKQGDCGYAEPMAPEDG